MQEIIASERQDYGLELFWKERSVQKDDFYSYSELIDMKINVLDLLENPTAYRIDARKRKVLATPKECCQFA